MFEKETETLEKIIRNNTIANTPSISLRNILESDIPQNVKSYFRGEVEWLLYKEQRSEKRSTKFDYGIDDIQMLQEQMDILLVYNFLFNLQDFSKTLNNCVHFLFNYLCRPQWTLENFLFDEKSVIPLRELSLKFRYCSDYSYFWRILEKHFESKNTQEITKEEFATLIKKIDAEIIKQHNASDLAKMTEPFFTFVNYIQQQLNPTDQVLLPTKALIYFFEDKKVSTVAKKLTSLREHDQINISYQELGELLKDFFVPQNFSLDDEIAKPIQDLQNKKSLPISIPDRERQAIVRHIFNNDESQFVHTVENILASPLWDDASLSLDHYFTMNDIDPFSREAIIFTNALQSHFIKSQNGDFN